MTQKRPKYDALTLKTTKRQVFLNKKNLESVRRLIQQMETLREPDQKVISQITKMYIILNVNHGTFLLRYLYYYKLSGITQNCVTICLELTLNVGPCFCIASRKKISNNVVQAPFFKERGQILFASLGGGESNKL